MTITLTDEMWEMWYKIKPYLTFNGRGNGNRFKDGTPQKIIDLCKEYDKLYQEQYEFELSLL